MEINGYIFNKLQQWQIDYLKDHYQDKITDIEITLGICDETIYRLLKALNINRSRLWYRVLPDTPEVQNDLKNPYLSHVKIAKKYNTTPDVVAQRRKRKGLQVRRNVGRTLLEEEIVRILDKLDIVYHEQKRIGKWSCDFYLGNKIIIDIHGEWAHNKEIVIERDSRKKQELEELQYNYLVILEKDLGIAEKLITQYLKDKFIWLMEV